MQHKNQLNRLDEALKNLREGRTDDAISIYQVILEQDPDDHVALHYLGLALANANDLQDAHRFLSQSLKLEPNCANCWSDLGMVTAKSGDYERSIEMFNRALKINENHSDALNNLATVLEKLSRPREALDLLKRLNIVLPDSPPGLCRLAETQYQLGLVEDAITNYQKAIRLEPGLKTARIGLGEAYETAGKLNQAKFQYYAVLRRDPDSPLAIAKILQLRADDIDEELIERAKTLADDVNTLTETSIRLNVALGVYFDRAGSHDEAFERFRLGCDQQFEERPFDSKNFTIAIDRLIEVFSADFFNTTRRQEKIPSDRPIFIVGMPRSGTTLVEQILSSHSQVEAGGELSSMVNVGNALQNVSYNSKRFPDGVLHLGRNGMSRLARQYLGELNRVSTGSQRITDKMPFNFVYLGLIALLFPNAAIVHCYRHPLDNCLSCYFTSFSKDIQFANNLSTLGSYYRDYRRLMDHWQAVLPSNIHHVEYESMVANPQESINQLVAECGLEMEESCLRFHESTRNVQTPSRWQVRQPIYTQSIQRWIHYEKHLGPLKDMLAPLLD